MRAIEAFRCAAMKSGGDQALCVLDFGLPGLSVAEALGELLAMRAGVPILVGAHPPAGSGEQRVRHIVRRSHNLESFRLTVSRLRRTGAAMYLKLEY